MNSSCSESCPVIADCKINTANAEFFVATNSAAIHETEVREIDARFDYAQLEEQLLAGDNLLGFGAGLLENSGWLLDWAEHNSREALENEPQRTEFWRVQARELHETEENILAICGFWARMRANLKRKSRIDPSACGSKDAYAKIVAAGLRDGTHKPVPNVKEQLILQVLSDDQES